MKKIIFIVAGLVAFNSIFTNSYSAAPAGLQDMPLYDYIRQGGPIQRNLHFVPDSQSDNHFTSGHIGYINVRTSQYVENLRNSSLNGKSRFVIDFLGNYTYDSNADLTNSRNLFQDLLGNFTSLTKLEPKPEKRDEIERVLYGFKVNMKTSPFPIAIYCLGSHNGWNSTNIMVNSIKLPVFAEDSKQNNLGPIFNVLSILAKVQKTKATTRKRATYGINTITFYPVA